MADSTPIRDHAAESLPERLKIVLRRSDQLMIAILLFASLIGIGIYTWQQTKIRQGLIDVDAAPRLQADYQVDINSADWTEFANLPGIGESTARSITRYREQNGVFVSIDELTKVHGIGPKKFESIKRYLLPIVPNTKTKNTNN